MGSGVRGAPMAAESLCGRQVGAGSYLALALEGGRPALSAPAVQTWQAHQIARTQRSRLDSCEGNMHCLQAQVVGV